MHGSQLRVFILTGGLDPTILDPRLKPEDDVGVVARRRNRRRDRDLRAEKSGSLPSRPKRGGD
jgi:hypothetical protein